jgi:hypothetical protein
VTKSLAFLEVFPLLLYALFLCYLLVFEAWYSTALVLLDPLCSQSPRELKEDIGAERKPLDCQGGTWEPK